jgi:diaminohydroxyphosphoribosylaminopyrimidine deaminase/5-amino-6-(5-phosphoribosylamino)uracil reductase
VKLAMSLDGRTALANRASQWITGEAAREDVQLWRARSSAILTGAGSVLADDPQLTVRFEKRRRSRFPPVLEQPQSAREVDSDFVAPLRVVLDSSLRMPSGAHLLDGTAPTLVFHAENTKPIDGRYAPVELFPVAAGAAGRLDLTAVLRGLAERGVNELQVEAGATLSGALFAAGLVDELLLYIAPVILGDQARPLLAMPRVEEMAAGRRLRVVDQCQVGADLRLLLRE